MSPRHGRLSIVSYKPLRPIIAYALFFCCVFPAALDAIQVTTSILPADIFTTYEIGNRSGNISAVATDAQGRVIAAVPNEDAIFSFDGSKWRKHEVEHAAYCLVEDKNGVVWAGTDRGVFQIRFDEFGQFSFLKFPVPFKKLDDQTMHSGRSTKNGVVFNNHSIALIITNQDLEIRRSDPKFAYRFVGHEIAYLTPVTGKGLFKIEKGKQTEVVGFKDHKIKTLAVMHDDTVVAIGGDDQIIHSVEGSTFPNLINELVDGGRILSLFRFDDDKIHVASVGNGYFELSPNGEVTKIIDAGSGLPAKGVYRVAKSSTGDIWLACTSSLVRVPRKPNVHLVQYEKTEVVSFCQSSINKAIYVGTNIGCFRIQQGRFGVSIQEYDVGAVNGVATQEDKAFAATTSGIFELKNGKGKRIREGSHVFLASITNDLIVTSDRSGHLFTLKKNSENNNGWSESKGPKQPFQIRSIVELEDRLWLAIGWRNRAAVMSINDRTSEISIKRIETTEKVIQKIDVGTKNETVLLCKSGLRKIVFEQGKYQLTELNSHQRLASAVTDRNPVAMFQMAPSKFIIAQPNVVELIDTSNDEVSIEGVWRFRLPITEMPELTSDKQRLIYVNSNIVCSIDLSKPDSNTQIPAPIVTSNVLANNRKSSGELELNPKDGILFQFSTPITDTPSEQIEYQQQLIGYDDAWSNWSNQKQKEYTNLPGGTYKFQVRARAGNIISPVYQAFPFTIQTPWFKRAWAITLFSLAALGLLLGLVALRARRMERAYANMEALVQLRSEQLQQQKEAVKEQSLAFLNQTRENESERLESLSRMLGGIVHDFNNLLFVVSTNCEILKMTLPSEQQQFVDAIHSAGDTAAGLCSQLQSYSSNFPVDPRRLSIEQVVDEMTDLLRSSVPANLEFLIECKSKTPAILADESEIQQMVLNLVVNAGEATKTRVAVRTGESWYSKLDLISARLCTEPIPGKYAWIEVSDNGAGISQEILNKIFDPFFSTKRLGRGLGLAIVSRVVSRQNGALFVSSRQKTDCSGTTFRIAFPCPENESSLEETSDFENIEMRTGLKLLIVDDEPSILVCLRQYFESMGLEVFVAANGEIALDMVNEGLVFDAALLDISLTGMNGDQLALELKMLRDNLPVILMSGFSEKELEKDVLNHSLVSFVKKPFSMIEVSEHLSRLIPHERAIKLGKKTD